MGSVAEKWNLKMLQLKAKVSSICIHRA